MDRVAGRSTTLSFQNTPLLRPDGASEPAISVGLDGTMALSGLSWTQFFTNVWKAPFGSTPVFQGQIDAHIGKSIGGGDADLDLGSTGTLRSEEHTSELQSQSNLVCRLLLEKKKTRDRRPAGSSRPCYHSCRAAPRGPAEPAPLATWPSRSQVAGGHAAQITATLGALPGRGR